MQNKLIPPLWENTEIQQINRLPMRSMLMPFASAKDAVIDALAGPEHRKPETNSYCFNLDAENPGSPWKFKLVDNPNKDDLRWVSSEFNKEAETWAEIAVPGTWCRQGGDERFEGCFGNPHYTNVQMPFEGTPPFTPEKNSTGLYRRTFALPAGWKGRRIVLRIGSTESMSMVYINGEFAGMGKDKRLPSEYDITPFLTDGENLLCIKVVSFSEASYIENQDEWWLGGIHRSVRLYSTEDCYIKDIIALPGSYSTENEKLKGKINLSVTLGGNLPKGSSFGWGGIASSSVGQKPFTIKYNLYPFTLVKNFSEAETLGSSLAENGALLSGEVEIMPNYRENSDTAEAVLVLDNPKLWSHEHPNLYIISVELLREGRFIESTAFCTGFRNIEITNRELRINDKMVYIRGANRHEHDEKTGKTISTAAMLNDIKLLKSHNFNAVRTSHYPNDERWYDLCDRYGIYLWDEADIESHCYYNQLSDDSRWLSAFVTRIQRMAERDKNHISVITWSLGNESGWGAAHNAGYAWLHCYDPTRPVQYEGVVWNKRNKNDRDLDRLAGGRNVTDIVCPMYPTIEGITDFVKYRDDPRPLIMCEFSHAMGNSNGSLEDYWKAIESQHGLQGGFIWEWRDHGFEAYTPDGVKYWKYGGDFGDTPSDMDFICDGLLWPDQSPKPAMEECRQLYAPVRLTPVQLKAFSFTLENRYDFSGLDNLILKWSISEDQPLNGAGTAKILKEGTMDLPSLNPGEKTELNFDSADLEIPINSGAIYFSGEFVLKNDTPWAKAGQLVARAGRVIKESTSVIPQSAGTNRSGSGADIAALFKPSLYRVPTQNDGLKTGQPEPDDPASWFYTQDKAMIPWIKLDLLNERTAQEKTESVIWEGRSAVRFSAVLLAGDKAFPEYKHFASGKGMGTYTLTIAKSEKPGLPLVMEAVFDLDRSLPELPRVGITAKIPSCYSEISWFGAGPHESYPDRLAAALPGRYRHKIEELEVPYVVPQENGNRSAVRSLTLIAANPPAGKPAHITIIADSPVNFSYSRYTKENMWQAKHTWELRDTASDGYFTLNIDAAQRGVGTNTCGPDTRMEYRVNPGLYRLKLYIL